MPNDKDKENFNSQPSEFDRHPECDLGGGNPSGSLHMRATNAQNKKKLLKSQNYKNDNNTVPGLQIRYKLVGRTPTKLGREKHNLPNPEFNYRK